ncbi:DUF1565 domain-containing protein [Microbacterium sp. A1-JK]|uniref:DUF1565 domain-containing protein n=1 Tax=Microbacterium sp. A1-JK TaxID=3177516 RepID=UPI003889D446
MASIYVRKTGNDTTGNGTDATPYLTINKALIAAVAGDEILVGAGTYAESSSAGYLSVSLKYTGRVTIRPETGVLGDVIVTGTSASAQWAVIFSGANTRWESIVFGAQSDAVAPVRFLAGTAAAPVTNIEFTRCRFLGRGAFLVGTAWTGATDRVNGIRFRGCEFVSTGSGSTAAIVLIRGHADGAVSDVEISHCNMRVSGRAVQVQGVTNLRVFNNDAISDHATGTATAFQMGVDGATGFSTSGLVMGNRFESTRGHALVVGAGCDGVLVAGNTVIGGDTAGTGQGIVIKEAANVRIDRNIVYGGYHSALYFKAAVDCQAVDNVVYSAFASADALRVEYNIESSNPNQRVTARRNTIVASAGRCINWGTTQHDSGGSICDENVYAISGTGELGSVRGTTVTTLRGIRAAWAAYSRPNNDRNSRTGIKEATFGGSPVVGVI